MTENPQRPNILFILSDDQGQWAMGCSGNTEIRTPHLDRLASRGAWLENFFCASPVCSPARASLLTGTIPSRHGVHDYLDGHEAGAGGIDYLHGQRLFTDVFVEAGYNVGLIGKWHLGASDQPRSGFAHWFALEGGSSPYNRSTMYRKGVKEVVDGYLTDILADDAISFLEGSIENCEPFFLSLNFTAPHKPWANQHPQRFEELYEDCTFSSCPQEEDHPWLARRDGIAIAAEPDIRSALIGYFAAVTAMDEAIGRVLDCLQRLGIDNETIIVFSSDNGFNCGHHGVWGKGNGTFPQNMYDSSVKVPAIVTWPGRIDKSTVITELLSAYDIAATLLDLAGLDPEEFERGPGNSFANLLLGASAKPPTRPVVVYDEYGPVRMLRTHEWKYVHRYPHGPHELYDLGNDPEERSNLIECPEHSDRIDAMRQSLHSWFTTYATKQNDGSALPVEGGGQKSPLTFGPLNAFAPRGMDSVPSGSSPCRS